MTLNGIYNDTNSGLWKFRIMGIPAHGIHCITIGLYSSQKQHTFANCILFALAQSVRKQGYFVWGAGLKSQREQKFFQLNVPDVRPGNQMSGICSSNMNVLSTTVSILMSPLTWTVRKVCHSGPNKVAWCLIFW